MTTKDLIAQADRILDSRNLAKPQIRKRAVRKVIEYMETTGMFLEGNQVALPSDKRVLKQALIQYYGKEPFSAGGAINIMYEAASTKVAGSMPRPTTKSKPLPTTFAPPTPEFIDAKDAEKLLINGKFMAVNAMNESSVPDVPGLYCIKLRKGVVLPAKFGKVREDGIIYIGQASSSLNQRFWRQELNHHGAATFFRSIGAILGYLPPKGSLAGKSTNNFKFGLEDTEAIRKWMRLSLLVNWIPFGTENMDAMEINLITKYRPLVNIKHNPSASEALEAARKACLEYAQNE